MPRRTRKRMVGKVENYEIWQRQIVLERLARVLRREWFFMQEALTGHGRRTGNEVESDVMLRP